MSKTNFISVLLLLLANSCLAQISIKEGPVLDVEKNAEFKRVIGYDDDAFYIYRVKTRGAGTHYFVEKYDRKTLQMLFSQDLLLEEYENAGIDPRFTGTWSVMGAKKIFVFFPVYLKKDKTKVFIVRGISKSGKMDPYKEVESNPDREAEFYVASTPDSSKILIINELQKAGEGQEVKATLYSAADMSKIWSKKLPGSYKKSGIRTSGYTINNDGTLVFYFAYMKDFDKEIVGGAIGVMNNNTDETSAIDLDFAEPKEPYFLEMKFYGNQLVCAGLFKDNDKRVKREKKIRKAGVFYYFVDVDNMKLTAEGNEYFPEDISRELTYSGPEGTNPGDKYYSSSVLEETDGNYYLLTEHGYNYTDGSLYRREIVVSKFSSEGKVNWTRLLKKSSSNQSGMYNVLTHNGKLYIFCLEHPDVEKKLAKGKDYDPGEYPTVSGISGPNVLAYEVDAGGKVSRHIIYKNEDFCYQPQFQDVQFQKDNDLLIYMKKGGKEKFGTIHVN